MLPTTNRTIEIKRLVQGAKKRTLQTVATGVPVYINSQGEEIQTGFDNEGAWKLYRMLTDATHTAILVGDKVIDDQGKTYEVKGAEEFDDLTGKHNQYLIVEAYD